MTVRKPFKPLLAAVVALLVIITAVELAAKGRARIIFINFGGVTFTNGKWDPIKNTLALPLGKSGKKKAVFPAYTPPCKTDSDCRVGKCSVPMPEKKAPVYNPFNEPAFKRCSKRDSLFEKRVVYHVQKALKPFKVKVVRKRPKKVNYDMIVVNYNSTMGLPHGGSAGLVCNTNRENMIYFVMDSRWGHGPKNIAKIVLHEFGHTLGLAHSMAPGPSTDPMNGAAFSSNKLGFENKCVKVDYFSYCGDELAVFCKKNYMNTYKTALQRLGKRKKKLKLTYPEEKLVKGGKEVSLEYTPLLGANSADLKSVMCKKGRLRGIKIHNGMIVDRIRGICMKGETGDLGSNTGNGPEQFICPGKNNVIESVQVWAHGYQDSIENVQVTCKGGQKGKLGGWNTQAKLQKKVLKCPGDSRLIGMRGNSGSWLKTLGLVCKNIGKKMSAKQKAKLKMSSNTPAGFKID